MTRACSEVTGADDSRFTILNVEEGSIRVTIRIEEPLNQGTASNEGPDSCNTLARALVLASSISHRPFHLMRCERFHFSPTGKTPPAAKPVVHVEPPSARFCAFPFTVSCVSQCNRSNNLKSGPTCWVRSRAVPRASPEPGTIDSASRTFYYLTLRCEQPTSRMPSKTPWTCVWASTRQTLREEATGTRLPGRCVL